VARRHRHGAVDRRKHHVADHRGHPGLIGIYLIVVRHRFDEPARRKPF
jgi:hypothetical protein